MRYACDRIAYGPNCARVRVFWPPEGRWVDIIDQGFGKLLVRIIIHPVHYTWQPGMSPDVNLWWYRQSPAPFCPFVCTVMQERLRAVRSQSRWRGGAWHHIARRSTLRLTARCPSNPWTSSTAPCAAALPSSASMPGAMLPRWRRRWGR